MITGDNVCIVSMRMRLRMNRELEPDYDFIFPEHYELKDKDGNSYRFEFRYKETFFDSNDRKIVDIYCREIFHHKLLNEYDLIPHLQDIVELSECNCYCCNNMRDDDEDFGATSVECFEVDIMGDGETPDLANTDYINFEIIERGKNEFTIVCIFTDKLLSTCKSFPNGG